MSGAELFVLFLRNTWFTLPSSLCQGNNVDLILTIQKSSVMPLQMAEMGLHLFLIQEACFLNVDVIQVC